MNLVFEVVYFLHPHWLTSSFCTWVSMEDFIKVRKLACGREALHGPLFIEVNQFPLSGFLFHRLSFYIT